MAALSTMSTKTELSQTDSRFHSQDVQWNVKYRYDMEFLSGISTKQLKPHIHSVISVFTCVALVCVPCSPLCEKHEHQSKYHSCGSHYKNQTSLTTFFPLHKICIRDCKTVLNYLNEIVHKLPCTHPLPPYIPISTASTAVRSHKLDRNACVTVFFRLYITPSFSLPDCNPQCWTFCPPALNMVLLTPFNVPQQTAWQWPGFHELTASCGIGRSSLRIISGQLHVWLEDVTVLLRLTVWYPAPVTEC